MCNISQLNNIIYHFDGFSFYNSLEPSNYWEQHAHQEIQIILPHHNAKAWIQFQSSTGKQYNQHIKVGQSFLLAPHQPHAFDWIQKAELTLFYLHSRFLEQAISESINSNKLELQHNFLLVNDTLIREIGKTFSYLCRHQVVKEKLYIESLANLLAVHLLKNYFDYDLKVYVHKQKLPHQKLKLILDYIEANIDQKINLSDLAQLIGVGKFYFCRLFKDSMGISPYQYILKQRVLRAKKLLKNSDLPICDISLECGFSNQSHLTKHFNSVVGKSPMKYRQEAK
ncbi:MAG: hypothetical protein Tsb0014_16020 [Pleurocapsa sp.]